LSRKTKNKENQGGVTKAPREGAGAWKSRGHVGKGSDSGTGKNDKKGTPVQTAFKTKVDDLTGGVRGC